MHLKRVRPFNHASFNFFCSARCARHPATSSSLLMRQPPHRRPTSGVDGCRAWLCEYTIIKTTPNVNTVTSMQFAELRVNRPCIDCVLLLGQFFSVLIVACGPRHARRAVRGQYRAQGCCRQLSRCRCHGRGVLQQRRKLRGCRDG